MRPVSYGLITRALNHSPEYMSHQVTESTLIMESQKNFIPITLKYAVMFPISVQPKPWPKQWKFVSI